jgi:hypothetical protein
VSGQTIIQYIFKVDKRPHSFDDIYRQFDPTDVLKAWRRIAFGQYRLAANFAATVALAAPII